MSNKRKNPQQNFQAVTKRKPIPDHDVWKYLNERQQGRLQGMETKEVPELSSEDYEVQTLSGESSTDAHLYLLTKIKDKSVSWVLKVISEACNQDEAKAQWRAGEASIGGRRSSNAVVAIRLVDIWNYGTKCVQLLEFFSEGTLGDLLYCNDLSRENCEELAKQIINLLVHLKAAGVVHGDLHPFNVAIVQKEPIQLRLFDFDSSRIMDKGEKNFDKFTMMDYRNLLCNLIPEYQATQGVVADKYTSQQGRFNKNAMLLVEELKRLKNVDTTAPGFFFETMLHMNEYRNETEQRLMAGWEPRMEGKQTYVCYTGSQEMMGITDTDKYNNKYLCSSR